MDYKKDRENLEAYLREKTGNYEDDEIELEDFLKYAFEYFEANPIADQTVKFMREAITFNRLTGEMDHWHRIPYTELYWRKGFFFNDIFLSIAAWKPRIAWLHYLNLRPWAEYFGIVDPKPEIEFYKNFK